MGDEPEALCEKDCQQSRRDALRQIEMEAAKAGKPVGHHDEESKSQSKWRVGGEDEACFMCVWKTLGRIR